MHVLSRLAVFVIFFGTGCKGTRIYSPLASTTAKCDIEDIGPREEIILSAFLSALRRNGVGGEGGGAAAAVYNAIPIATNITALNSRRNSAVLPQDDTEAIRISLHESVALTQSLLSCKTSPNFSIQTVIDKTSLKRCLSKIDLEAAADPIARTGECTTFFDRLVKAVEPQPSAEQQAWSDCETTAGCRKKRRTKRSLPKRSSRRSRRDSKIDYEDEPTAPECVFQLARLVNSAGSGRRSSGEPTTYERRADQLGCTPGGGGGGGRGVHVPVTSLDKGPTKKKQPHKKPAPESDCEDELPREQVVQYRTFFLRRILSDNNKKYTCKEAIILTVIGILNLMVVVGVIVGLEKLMEAKAAAIFNVPDDD